jgi:hypothetical protein
MGSPTASINQNTLPANFSDWDDDHPAKLPADFSGWDEPKPRASVPGMERLGGAAPAAGTPPPPPGPLESPQQLKSRRVAANAPSFINPRTGKQYFGDDRGTGPLRVLDAPTEGAQEIGEGVSQMAEPGLREKAGGLHKAIGGAFKAATPLMVGAGAVAPLSTAATLAASMGAQAGTEKGLTAAGVAPEYAGLAGDVAGFAAGGLAGSKLHARGAPEAPPEPAPIPDSTDTIKIQVGQLASGQRKAVLVTPNAAEVPTPPPGFKTVDTKDGTLIYNPKLTNARTLKRASAFNKLNEVLGPTEGGMGPESKADIQASGEPPVAVVAKAPDGTPAQETLATPEKVPEAAQQADKVTPPGGAVTTTTPEQVVGERIAKHNAVQDQPVVLQDFEGGRGGFAEPARMVLRSDRTVTPEEIRSRFFPEYGPDKLTINPLRNDELMGAVQPGRQSFDLQFRDGARQVSAPPGIEEKLGLGTNESSFHRGQPEGEPPPLETPPPQLEAPKAETPTQPNGERGAISGDLATLGLGKAALAAREQAKAFVEDAMERSEEKQYKENQRIDYTGERDVRVAETNQLRDALKKVIPDTVDQEALSLMRDFKKKPGEMEQFLNGTHPSLAGLTPEARASAMDGIQKLAPAIERAMDPTPELKAADQVMTEYFDQHLEEGKKLGFLKSNISSDEYISHLLEPKDAEEMGKKFLGSAAGRIGRTTPFSKKRYYPTILDAVADGVRPRTLNALDALTIYGDKHATAAATHILINNLQESGVAKWGTSNSKNMPKDWVPLAPESHLFRNEVPYTNAEGEADIAHQSLMVPPKVADALRPITDPNYMSRVPFFASARMYQAYLKSVELGMSGFHLKALNLAALGNEGVTGLVKTYQSDMQSPEFLQIERDGIKAGLTTPILGRTIEAYKAVNKSSIPTIREKIQNAPGIKQLVQTAEAISHLTFNVVQRKMKVTDFAIKDAKWMADHPEATPQEHTLAQRSIAKQVNAVYGGLQWENIGVNRMTLEIGKALLLAPDWTFSNFQNVKQAFQGGPAGDASRIFWLRTAITGVALTQGTSLLLSGRLSKDPTSVLMGQDDRGRDITQNMFFAGAPGDFVNLVKNAVDYGVPQGVAQSAASKLSPIARTATQMIVNRGYDGQPIVPKGTRQGEAALRSGAHLAKNLLPIPFAVSGPLAMLTNKNQSYSPTEYATSILAGGHSRHVAPTKATALLDQYNQEDAATVRHPKERNQIKNQITSAIGSGDMDRARQTARSAVAAGKITHDDLVHSIERAQTSPIEADFKRLDLDRALNVFAVATPEEKEKLGQEMFKKVQQGSRTLPPAELDRIHEKIAAIR